MRTLIEDAISKTAQGLTTLEAILQVVSPDDAAPPVGAVAAAGDPVPAYLEKELEREAVGRMGSTENAVVECAREKERILIVEDHRTVTSVVKYFLELEGFEVVVAKDGLIGLEAAKRELPDVIVTDCNMPGMDGVALVGALRADARTQDIATPMLTSGDSADGETHALAAGAYDYILKPVEPRRLVARIKALLALKEKAARGPEMSAA
jgi:CheY-like chemotaxis protein